MAENKKSFLLYTDLIHTVRKMPKNKAGELFMTILSYVNDENPVVTDALVDVVFEPIKRQMKRDLEKYETAKIDKSNGGKLGNLKRWNKDLYDKVLSKELKIEDAEIIASGRIASHTDGNRSHTIASVPVTVTVTDNVNDTVTDINNISFKKETKAKFQFKVELIKHGFEECLVDDWLKVRKTKRATNTETAMKAFLTEIQKSTIDKNEILKICVQRSWSGFKNEWLNNINNNFSNGTAINKVSDHKTSRADSVSAGQDTAAALLREQLDGLDP